jgi:hypothetical protein
LVILGGPEKTERELFVQRLIDHNYSVILDTPRVQKQDSFVHMLCVGRDPKRYVNKTKKLASL